MAAADAGGLHGARGGKIRRAEAHAVHARGGDRDCLDIVDALRRLQNGVDHDRLCDLVPRFELGEQLVEVMDVPGPVDLGQHDDVELVADRRDDLGDVVERPGRIERIDARPQSGRPEIDRLAHGDEARARRLLGLDGDGVLEVAEHHVDLAGELGHLGAHLLVVRRHEMDHALEPHRQVAHRRRRADGQRLEKLPRGLHAGPVPSKTSFGRLEQCKGRAKSETAATS